MNPMPPQPFSANHHRTRPATAGDLAPLATLLVQAFEAEVDALMP